MQSKLTKLQEMKSLSKFTCTSMSQITVELLQWVLPVLWCSAGVYKEPNCMWKEGDLDHAVTLMGYGTTHHGEDYWLIK